MPFPTDTKPRKFLQTVGTMVREYNPDAFVHWMDRKIKQEFVAHRAATEQIEVEYGPVPFAVVIDDVRMHNEAKWIHENNNGILIRLTARPEVAKERILDRDGVLPTEEMNAHESEQQSSTINEEWFDAVIDTSDFSVGEQVFTIRNAVNQILGLPPLSKLGLAHAQNS